MLWAYHEDYTCLHHKGAVFSLYKNNTRSLQNTPKTMEQSSSSDDGRCAWCCWWQIIGSACRSTCTYTHTRARTHTSGSTLHSHGQRTLMASRLSLHSWEERQGCCTSTGGSTIILWFYVFATVGKWEVGQVPLLINVSPPLNKAPDSPAKGQIQKQLYF